MTALALAQTSEKLYALPSATASKGSSLAFFFDPAKERIQVITTLGERALSDFLGDSWPIVDYTYGEAKPLTRSDDYPAYWGGAKSHWAQDPDPTNYCTTAFTIKDSSNVRHMVQPAHCGPVGGTVKTWTLTHTVGTYGNKHCGNVGALDNSDVQWISGQSYGRSIYIGGEAGSRADVIEAGAAATGVSYRYSGATTFEKSGQVVISTDASIWWADENDWCDGGDGSGWWQLHLISFNRSGVCDADGGDSGAPFFVKYAGTPPQIGIRGMVTAEVGNICFAEKWSRIASLLGGVSIYTG